MGRTPDVALRLGEANELLDDPQARPIADHVRMAGELEDSALLIGRLEFSPRKGPLLSVISARAITSIGLIPFSRIDRIVSA